jgi:hypothetical protein
MGRTARQGDPGSYSMVLSHSHLDYINMNAADITTMVNTKKFYETIDEFRSAFFLMEYEASLENMTDVKGMHDKSEEFLENLMREREVPVREFLVEINRVPVVHQSAGKTICLMDATGSMSGLLTKAKNKVSEMYRRIEEIFSEKHHQGGFEMQFAVYRNYNCDMDRILQSSGWASDSSGLSTFMSNIGPEGGWSNEAVEVGLWHVNRMLEEGTEIAQIILIGDMPPNTREEVASKRSDQTYGKGESYWRSTPLSRPTYYEDELQSIIARGIPVHCFPVAHSADSKFGEIAERTGGQFQFLDVNSAEGGEQLTNVVSIRVLYNAGGDSFVEAYNSKWRGHV